ncbi:unnamed protein product [Lampetra planeri]
MRLAPDEGELDPERDRGESRAAVPARTPSVPRRGLGSVGTARGARLGSRGEGRNERQRAPPPSPRPRPLHIPHPAPAVAPDTLRRLPQRPSAETLLLLLVTHSHQGPSVPLIPSRLIRDRIEMSRDHSSLRDTEGCAHRGLLSLAGRDADQPLCSLSQLSTSRAAVPWRPEVLLLHCVRGRCSSRVAHLANASSQAASMAIARARALVRTGGSVSETSDLRQPCAMPPRGGGWI